MYKNTNLFLYYSLSETEEEDSSSENDTSEPYKNSRQVTSSTNLPPVVEKPPFRKYGVNDFRYLKVTKEYTWFISFYIPNQ